MTKTRQEIKAYAKHAFASQRKPAILGMFLTFLPFVVLMISIQVLNAPMYFSAFTGIYTISLFGIWSVAYFFIWLLAMGVQNFLFPVLNINLCGLFVKVFYGQPVRFSEPYTDLRVNYGRKLGGYWWSYLWMMLWSLVAWPAVYAVFMAIFFIGIMQDSLFIANNIIDPSPLIISSLAAMSLVLVPVIIKGLAYCMQPYILAAHPNVTATNALKLSKRMTKGYRGKIFVMWLSFIGWHLLNVLTLGILGIFFVGPYMYTTMAGYFVELRNTAVASGTIHPAEFDGYVHQYHYPQYNDPQSYYPPQYHEQITPHQPVTHDHSQDQYPPQ